MIRNRFCFVEIIFKSTFLCLLSKINEKCPLESYLPSDKAGFYWFSRALGRQCPAISSPEVGWRWVPQDGEKERKPASRRGEEETRFFYFFDFLWKMDISEGDSSQRPRLFSSAIRSLDPFLSEPSLFVPWSSPTEAPRRSINDVTNAILNSGHLAILMDHWLPKEIYIFSIYSIIYGFSYRSKILGKDNAFMQMEKSKLAWDHL